MRVLPPFRRILTEPVLRRRALIISLTALLSPLPLVGTLGYESSLVLTAPLSLLGIGTGVDAIRTVRARTQGEQEATGSLIGTAGPAMLRDALGLLGLALAVIIVAQLWNRSCDPLDGLAFFALGPGLSVVLGGISGLWGAAVVRSNARRRQLLVGFVPMLACLCIGGRRLYADPVVFAFDPFWGYFAGPLYDEAVAITPRYLWFRAYNVVAGLCAAMALHLWALPHGTLGPLRRPLSRPWSMGLFAALLATTGYFGLQADRHHFTATVDSLSRELPGTLQTEHFVIHYAPDGKAARQLELIAAEHEFAWHRLADRVGHEPAIPVHSFLFPSPARKRVLMGAGRTEVAPPWRGHLYLNEQSFPHRVLHHELAHAFSAPIGDPLFGIAGHVDLRGIEINLALVEGFAEALAPRPRNGLDLHDQATVLHQLELRPPLRSLMGLSFWGKSSRHAYAAAGSFCLWLVQTRGVERFVTLYGNAGDFDEAYGVPLSELETEWVQFLEDHPIRPKDIEAQRQRYKKRSIFKRPCAHRSANLLKAANSAGIRGDHQGSLERLKTLCQIEPDRTEHEIRLGQAQARAGLYESAVATLQAAAADPEITHTLASSIDEKLGDLAMLRGEHEVASAHYQAVLGRSVSEPVARSVQIKERGTHDPRLAELVMDYLAPFEWNQGRSGRATRRIHAAMQMEQLSPHAPLGAYLVGIQLLSAQHSEAAAEAFERALAPGAEDQPLTTPELIRAARENLLNVSVRRRDYARAREVLAELVADPDIGNGHRYTYQLWSERIEFFSVHRPAT